MTTHVTLRLAWHSGGGNGRICETSVENSYCIGCSSYAGVVIHRRCDPNLEKKDGYAKHYPGQLVVTEESETLSKDAADVIAANFG